MPVNNNLKINFNTPVIFDKEVLKNKKPIEKALISIGQVADEYLHIGNKYLKVNATKIESVSIKSPLLKSVFKVFSYILSIGLLPAIASIAKAVYKNWAQKQPLPEQKPPSDKVNQEIPTATDPSSHPTSTSTEPSRPSTNKEDPVKKEDSTKSETEQPQSNPAEVEDVDTETSPEAKAFYKQTKNGRIVARGAKASVGQFWQKSTSTQNLSKAHSSNDLQKQIDDLLNELQSENNTSDDASIVKKLLEIRRLMPKNSSTDYALNTVNANLLKSIATPPPVENKEEIYNKEGLVAIQTRITGGIPAKWLGLDELTYKCISYILTKNQKDRKFLPKFNNEEKKALFGISARKKEEDEKLNKGQRQAPIARTESKKFVYLNLNQFRSNQTSSSLSTVDEDSEEAGTLNFKQGGIDSAITSEEESEDTGTVRYNEKTVASRHVQNNLSSEEESSDENSLVIHEDVEDRPFNHQLTKDKGSSSDEDSSSADTFIEKL